MSDMYNKQCQLQLCEQLCFRAVRGSRSGPLWTDFILDPHQSQRLTPTSKSESLALNRTSSYRLLLSFKIPPTIFYPKLNICSCLLPISLLSHLNSPSPSLPVTGQEKWRCLSISWHDLLDFGPVGKVTGRFTEGKKRNYLSDLLCSYLDTHWRAAEI